MLLARDVAPPLVAAVSTCRLWLTKPSGAVLLMGTAEFVVCQRVFVPKVMSHFMILEPVT